jgi:hypothetical protein
MTTMCPHCGKDVKTQPVLSFVYNLQGIDAALKMQVVVLSGFVWKDTPQGFKYWFDQHCSGKLTKNARKILETWLNPQQAIKALT